MNATRANVGGCGDGITCRIAAKRLLTLGLLEAAIAPGLVYGFS